jgi:hypothetical protein
MAKALTAMGAAGSGISGPAQPLRLETAHLTSRSSRLGDRPVAHHPAHRRIVAQPVSVVRILIAGEPSEYRLPQQADQSVAAVLARARIGKRVAAGVRQAQRVIQLAIRQQNRASEVITLPRNCSIRCRSKSSCDELNQHRSLTL